MKQKIGIEKALALVFLALCIAAPQLAKPYVDTFAYGTSYARVYGIAVFALLLAFSAELQAIASKFMKMKADVKAWHVIGAILLLFLYSALGQYLFISGIGGELQQKYIVFDQRGYTSTQILHIHISKTLFCPFDPSDDVDCARPALQYLPFWYPYLGMLLFALAGIASVAHYPKLKTHSDKFIFLILAFASIKTAVDGGPFNYESLSFFMLVPFLLLNRYRLASTLIGAALWLAVMPQIYRFYDPVQLAMPMLVFFYPIAIALLKPKILFPLLLISLMAPSYSVSYSDVVIDRWAPDACGNSGASPHYGEVVLADLYTPCKAEVELACGRVEAKDRTVAYEGWLTQKPELIISRALAGKCGNGVFGITSVQGSISIIKRDGNISSA